MSALVIGTRGSQLAIWQAEYIAGRLRAQWPGLTVSLQFFTTQGDRIQDKPLPQIGGKGLFTAELEEALRQGAIQLAVHSLKDLPTDLAPEFTIGAIPERAPVADVLISRQGYTLHTLPLGAVVGTSSLRRSAQVKALRPDIVIQPLRGNVPTRVQKALAADGGYDAIVLAHAGLERLGLDAPITEVLPLDVMLPAPAQGALGVQCRTDDAQTRVWLAPLDHQPTRLGVEAERAFLNALDSGCRLPVAAYGHFEADQLHLIGRVISLDGTQTITVSQAQAVTESTQATALGQALAREAIQRGADALLDAVRAEVKP
jgi:hydroxymethylbilane synthase